MTRCGAREGCLLDQLGDAVWLFQFGAEFGDWMTVTADPVVGVKAIFDIARKHHESSQHLECR